MDSTYQNPAHVYVALNTREQVNALLASLDGFKLAIQQDFGMCAVVPSNVTFFSQALPRADSICIVNHTSETTSSPPPRARLLNRPAYNMILQQEEKEYQMLSKKPLEEEYDDCFSVSSLEASISDSQLGSATPSVCSETTPLEESDATQPQDNNQAEQHPPRVSSVPSSASPTPTTSTPSCVAIPPGAKKIWIARVSRKPGGYFNE